MTIINKISIGPVDYKVNDIKMAIINNEPIEEKLNVIVVISNPCLYVKRYKLLREFVKRIEEEKDRVNLFIVEMIYTGQQFIVTDKNNKNHLQLKTETPIWHKENMINLGVQKLLPKDYKAFAWIDADIEFENGTWALDTLKILNGSKDVVQLFSHCVDMSNQNSDLQIYNGFGYSFSKQKKYTTLGIDYWHPGYAWAITRKAYEKIGGLYEKGILGSSDSIMALSFINLSENMNSPKYNSDYNDSMLEYKKKASQLRLGYVPGVIRHYYHGSKQNRNYTERWKILMKYEFSPIKHITYSSEGIMIPTKEFNNEFKEAIMDYFRERKEDEE